MLHKFWSALKYISLLVFCLFVSTQASHGQNISIVKGKFGNFEFSKISIQSDEDPFTGARDKFEGILMDSGSFMIQAELYAAGIYLLFADETPLVQIFLCPGEDLTITRDSSGFRFNGSTGDYNAWSQVLRADYLDKYTLSFAESKVKDQKNIDSLVSCLFELRAQNASAIDKLVDEFALSECEYLFCKNETDYAIYTYLWSDFLRRGYSIEHPAFQFMNGLRLDDTKASKISLSYNRALEVFLYLNLRLEHKWYDPKSFDPTSDSFNNLLYEKILTGIPNEDVRNGLLTRKVISLLGTGSTSGEPLFKRYLNDCTDSFYKKAAFKYYNDYRKEKQFSGEKIRIETLGGPLFDKLKFHKGKILYLDFWASWCGPCMHDLPFTAKLQQKYRDRGVEVIYVNIDDNIGAAESAAKRLGLTGSLIYLDKTQSEEVRKELQMQGIPHYTLVDANRVIVDIDAAGPDSGTIEIRLNELLGK
jgi:thiol-disulfide isomerase/thioredoxin